MDENVFIALLEIKSGEIFLNTNINKIIIFGNKDMAELACFYFRNDSNYVPVAFCVDGDYLKESRFNDLPVIAFEDIEKEYPPATFNQFVKAPTCLGEE